MTKKPPTKKKTDAVNVQFRKISSPGAMLSDKQSTVHSLVGDLFRKIETCGVPIKKIELERTESVFEVGSKGRMGSVSLTAKVTFDLIV